MSPKVSYQEPDSLGIRFSKGQQTGLRLYVHHRDVRETLVSTRSRQGMTVSDRQIG